MSCRDGFCFSIFSIHNKNNSWTPLASVGAAGRVCTNTSGDAGMKKASTRLLEQETQTPSPAPDLIPAESSTENLHWDWYSKRGHFRLLQKRITLLFVDGVVPLAWAGLSALPTAKTPSSALSPEIPKLPDGKRSTPRARKIAAAQPARWARIKAGDNTLGRTL